MDRCFLYGDVNPGSNFAYAVQKSVKKIEIHIILAGLTMTPNESPRTINAQKYDTEVPVNVVSFNADMDCNPGTAV